LLLKEGGVISGIRATTGARHVDITKLKIITTAINEANDQVERRWYNNAREIAAFLASINPFWSRREWENMLFNHLALVKTEAVDMLNADYLAGINIYTEMERQALEMADTMSEGIIKQFPDKFQ
jgi:hypothetical protein